MSAFDWDGYLSLAEELAAREGDQAAARTAVNRAYYAAFGMARCFLSERGVGLPMGGLAHTAVWNRRHAAPDTVYRRISDSGRQLHRQRGRADDEEVIQVAPSDVHAALGLARLILADLADLAAATTQPPLREPAS